MHDIARPGPIKLLRSQSELGFCLLDIRGLDRLADFSALGSDFTSRRAIMGPTLAHSGEVASWRFSCSA